MKKGWGSVQTNLVAWKSTTTLAKGKVSGVLEIKPGSVKLGEDGVSVGASFKGFSKAEIFWSRGVVSKIRGIYSCLGC
jgi:hypothetical protein